MSEFNIRLAEALNNLRATILGTLLIWTIAIMLWNSQPFSWMFNESSIEWEHLQLTERSTNIGDGIDNDFRIIFVFFSSSSPSWQSFGPLTLMVK